MLGLAYAPLTADEVVYELFSSRKEKVNLTRIGNLSYKMG